MKMVLASNNIGKLKEFRELFINLPYQLVSQAEVGVEDVEETGLSFIENAILKARHAANITGMPALADDSGLCVYALNGEPGIYSARYAGVKANSADNIQKLLHALKDIPEHERAAEFHCVLALITHASDPMPLICEGRWKGYITFAPQGEAGFGYDPIFFVPEFHKTSAELPPEVKNQVSHRGLAMQCLLKQLSEKLCPLSASNN